ncbi:hypothetical protein CASFOL_008285 [Castilleja foliolosa]|uniref:Uncharacterized protein n=1 Tax=Castilleja foliolosa TaxID=1961234 RepID=A0ABD3E0H6_9LAMI
MSTLDFESSSGKEQKWEGKQIADGLQLMMDIPRHKEGVKIMVEENKLIIKVKGWFVKPLGTSDFESSPEGLHLLMSHGLSKEDMMVGVNKIIVEVKRKDGFGDKGKIYLPYDKEKLSVCGKPLGVIGGCEINRCNDLPFFNTLREAVDYLKS